MGLLAGVRLLAAWIVCSGLFSCHKKCGILDHFLRRCRSPNFFFGKFISTANKTVFSVGNGLTLTTWHYPTIQTPQRLVQGMAEKCDSSILQNREDIGTFNPSGEPRFCQNTRLMVNAVCGRHVQFNNNTSNVTGRRSLWWHRRRGTQSKRWSILINNGLIRPWLAHGVRPNERASRMLSQISPLSRTKHATRGLMNRRQFVK